MSKHSLCEFVSADHKAACRVLAFALAGRDPDIWLMLASHWNLTLAPKEIAIIAGASLRALDPDDAGEVSRLVLGEDVSPLPTFMDVMDDARFWASHASRNTLKAYALASFEAMHPKDRAAFLDHVTTDRRAA